MSQAPQPVFTVIGLGLSQTGRERLSSAFPDCILFGSEPSEQRKARTRAENSGRVTLFVDLPAPDAMVHVRASLAFDQTRVKVLALCEECTHPIYDSVLLLEFSGAIPVNSDDDTYRRAAAAVQRGEIWVSREYLSVIARSFLKSTARVDLSEREMDILKLMADDHSNQDIANLLFISRETVRWHLRSLYAKLGVSDREAARLFARNTLLHR